MTQPNFRRGTVPAPPPGTSLPDTGGLPFAKGVTLTPWTRNMLKGMGWKEGDPIPGEIGTHIQRAVAEAQRDQGGLPVPGAKPGDRTKIGRQVNFEDLSPERQEELRDVMAQYQQELNSPAAQQARSIEAGLTTLSPGVQAAARQAAVAVMASNAKPAMPEVVLTRGGGPDFRRPQPPPPPPVTPPQPAPQVTQAVPPPAAAAPEPEPEAPVSPPEESGDAGGIVPVQVCPRCLWNLSHAFEAWPTPQDRVAFVATILGSSRFVKSYAVMGGGITLWFRSLLAAETDLIFKQMRYDALNQQILGEVDYFSRLNVYRLTCMLYKITDERGAIVTEVPDPLGIPYDEQPGETLLVPFVGWFNDNVCTTESLRHIASQHHRQFQRVVEALEAQTGNADFWKGIGQPR